MTARDFAGDDDQIAEARLDVRDRQDSRMVNLRFRRDELAEQISDLTRRLAMAEPVITPAKIEKLALLLRDKLRHGPPDLRQAYARLLLSEVRVQPLEIRISGSKAVLARSAAAGVAKTTPAVLSFVREWCTFMEKFRTLYGRC